MRILRDAQKNSKEAGDTFIGTIHLIVPLTSDAQLAKIFTEAGATEQGIKQAINTVRAGKKVDSKQAEEGFEALSKYGINLTDLARWVVLD
jgi:ATP-dependent Clp protease ATP-binding subunit ClpB